MSRDTVMPAELRPGVLLDHEARDALVGTRRERDEAGALAVRDPRLRARDHVLVAVAHGRTRSALVSLPASGSDSDRQPRSSPAREA